LINCPCCDFHISKYIPFFIEKQYQVSNRFFLRYYWQFLVLINLVIITIIC
jgi:hypothetical protein